MSDTGSDSENFEVEQKRSVDVDERLDGQAEVTDLPEDLYSVAVCAILIDVEELWIGTQHKALRAARIAFVVLFQLISTFGQVLVLTRIRMLITKVELHAMLPVVDDFYKKVDFGNEDEELAETQWQNWLYKKDICQWSMSQLILSFFVLWQWTMTMVHEVRLHFRCLWAMIHLAAPKDKKDLCEVEYNPSLGDDMVITRMSLLQKILLTLFVYFPKFIVAVFLLFCGTEYLHHTSSFPDMVMNQFNLHLIITFDDYVYFTIVSAFQEKRVRNTKFFLGSAFSHSNKEPPLYFLLQIAKLLGTMGWVLFYILILEQSFKGFPYFWVWDKCSTAVEGYLNSDYAEWDGYMTTPHLTR